MRLPRLASEVIAEWGLTQDGVPVLGSYAVVVPVRDAHGTPLVVKLAPAGDADGAGEIAALKAWRGQGAVRLERADPRRRVLLLERLGDHDLSALGDLEACEVVGRLCRRLHRPPVPQLPALAGSVTRWLDDLAALGRDVPAPPRFVEQALHAGRALASDPAAAVVHGDLHYGNVLAARREPWLVIDPKGFNGDPCYEFGPMLWNRWDDLAAAGDVGHGVRERFYALVDAAGLDERRCRDWVVVRAMVGIGWEVREARGAGRPLTPAQRGLVTRYVTTAKAMQAVAP